MSRAMERYEAGKISVLPVVLRPMDDWSTMPFGKLQALPGNGKPVVSWPDRDDAWTNVAQGIRSIVKEGKLPPIVASPAPLPSVWNIPYRRNAFFTGRDELLGHLSAMLSHDHAMTISQAQALSGLGGIGKTQVAVEYAYRYRSDYQTVLWTEASTRESLVSGYVAIAGLLNLPEKDEQDQTRAVEAVKRWFTTHTGWLLILDNVEDLALVDAFLPPVFGGHLLLTTRAQATGTRAFRIEVDSMSEEVGALFLLRRAKLLVFDAKLTDAIATDVATAREICKELGGLPLALDQVGAYIEETRCSLLDYQRVYQQRRMEMLKRRGEFSSDYPFSVATTWTLSFERVKQQNSAAVDLLRCCAVLHPDAIPEELFKNGSTHLGLHLQRAIRDSAFDDAVRVLLSYSLIRRDPTAATFAIHRLVQAILIDALPTRTRKHWRERVVRTLNEAFPEGEFEEWTRCERLLPHVLACVTWIEHEAMPTPEASHVLHKAGVYLRERAQYSEAEPLLARAISIREKHLGAEHPDTAMSLHNLAILYWYQGKYRDAESLYQRAISIREKHLGTEHPDTARSLNNLAVLYWQQGRYEMAEPLYQRVISIREKHLGAEHLDTARSLNNLANLYQDQGKYEEAEPLFLRALQIKEQQLGTEHPDTATSLNNLAELYRLQGKYEEVESLYRRALSIFEQHLGVEHPYTAHPLHGSAELYRQLGKYDQAEPLYQRALAIREQCLGPTHPSTQETRKAYAAFLRLLGRNGEATMLDTDYEPQAEEGH